MFHNHLMDSADKAAIVAGITTASLGSVLVATMATPVGWAALAYGTYRMAKLAYQEAKRHATVKEHEDDSWWQA